jgi:hypothetical protein
MAHIHYIEDAKGDVVDLKVYCSDHCNKTDNPETYLGWNGCHETSVTQHCESYSCTNVVMEVA